MAEMQLHTTCDNCISVAEHARILQYSETEELLRLYDEEYQSQLLANVASSKCHMCTLFHANIPRLSEPFESGLELAIRVLRLRKDPLAVMIELVGQTNTDFKIYAGSLRVHEGEIWPKFGKMRADLLLSWTRKYPDYQIIRDVVPRIIELHTILAE